MKLNAGTKAIEPVVRVVVTAVAGTPMVNPPAPDLVTEPEMRFNAV